MSTPWIGVDLDGTLAKYSGWRGPDHIGEPIDPMVARVVQWLAEGKDVRIFTARVACGEPERSVVIAAIGAWCQEHFGCVLPVTNEKDMHMIQLWDERAVGVETNTGAVLR